MLTALLLSLAVEVLVHRQPSAPSARALEVAWVKQNVSAATGLSFFFPPGRVTITDVPLVFTRVR